MEHRNNSQKEWLETYKAPILYLCLRQMSSFLIDKQSFKRHIARLKKLNEDSTLANSAQSRKRARQSEKARLHNMSQKSTIRTSIKNALKAITSKEATARALCQTVAKLVDQAVNKKLLHKNKAARIKSRLNAKLRTGS